jgi:hypothetical protein
VLAECREDVAVEEVAVLCPRGWTYVSSALHPLACVLSERDATSAGIHRYASQFVSFDSIRIGVCVLPSLERAGYHSPADSGPDVVDGYRVLKLERERLRGRANREIGL